MSIKVRVKDSCMVTYKGHNYTGGQVLDVYDSFYGDNKEKFNALESPSHNTKPIINIPSEKAENVITFNKKKSVKKSSKKTKTEKEN